MYRVLIADDEMPALRYTRNIIQQFCSQFQIVDAVISGAGAGNRSADYGHQHARHVRY